MIGKLKKNLASVLLVSTVGIAMFFVGFSLGERSVFCPVCAPEDINFSLFWETFNKLKQEYVDPDKIKEKGVLYGAISGMVKSLGDPYTVFMTPQESKQFMEDVSGRFEGVGMEIGVKANGLQVIAPLEGTPAQRAGLRAGDKIIKINGQSTQDMTVDEAARLIRGPKGTKVTLTIFREEWDKVQDIEIERAVIEIPSLEWKLIDDNIAYIKIYHFTEKAGFEFSKIAIQVLASDADRIILDLRNNPGGYLEVANNIASYFLKKGSLITIEDSGEQKKEHRSRAGSVFTEYPTVILINEGSASGSEILAGALRDNRGIKLIGKQSFGKGSVQRLEDLSDGSSLKVTTAKWLTPKGETIHGVGLKPDIEVDLTEQDYLNDKDPQLEKAIEVIKNL